MKLLVLLLCATAVLGKHDLYQGWKSYYVGPASADKLKAFHEAADILDLDVLSHPIVQREGVVLVKPQEHDDFLTAVEKLGIPYRLHTNDVKQALDVDDVNIERKNLAVARSGSRSMPYDNYQPLDVIYGYMEEIATKYPDTVTLVEAPERTFEGRIIKYLKISTTNFEDESKPVIFIDGGIHSREWISPPTVTWAIHKLVEDVTEPDLLDKFDWILHPMVNPDGYVHTFSNRFWRKTRSTDQHILSPSCPGVDGNRNYDFFWNSAGTSPSPCTDIYAGSKPFSESETRVVRDILQEHLHRTALYLTMHSYGSLILYPWGHDGSLSNNALALHVVGVAMAQEMDARSLPSFPNYIVGNSALVLNYAVAGAAEDYAHYIGVPLSYTYELPGLARGADGFHLDPIYIEQVCEETWAGIVVGARRAGELYEGIIVP